MKPGFLLLSLSLLFVVAIQAKDREVSYFDDMKNPIELKIVPQATPDKPITVYVKPQEVGTVTIPGSDIAELTINEINEAKGKTVKTETLVARKKKLSLDPAFVSDRHYDKNDTLNKDERYVIVHNRINPNRNFRILNPRDLKIRGGNLTDTVKEGAENVKESIKQSASSFAESAGEFASGAGDFVLTIGEFALIFLSKGQYQPRGRYPRSY